MLRIWSRNALVVLATTAVFVCINANQAAGFDGTVQGVVKDSSGAPVSGAFVKLVNAEKHLTFMVISQAQGRYTAGNLPPGNYKVQGIGNGFESEKMPVDVAAGRAVTADLSLTAEQGPILPPAMPAVRREEWPIENRKVKEPPVTLPEGAGKKIVATKCNQCHELGHLLRGLGDRAKWERTVRTMRAFAQSTSSMIDLTDQEAGVVAGYLAVNFPGEREARVVAKPNSRLPRTLPQGDAARYMIVEYEVPAPDRGFHEITVDPRGTAWLSELSGGSLGKFDPKSLTFSEVAAPTPPAASKKIILNGMERGQGDQIWTVEAVNRQLMRFDSKTGEFNLFTVPKLKWGSPNANSIRVHPDGTIWWAAIQANEVVRFNPATRKFTDYYVPIAVRTGKRSAPYGMAISGDGKVWFAINEFDLMGRLDPATGKVEEFPIPLQNWNGWIDARRMTSDRNGDVWVGINGASKLMKIDQKTAKMTFYSPPTEKSGVYGICGDPKNNVIWFAEDSTDKIGRFDPKTETFLEFPVPNAETDMRRLEVDPTNPNRVWYSGVTTNRVGYIELLDGNGKPK